MIRSLAMCAFLLPIVGGASVAPPTPGNRIVHELKPSAEIPRNSEGAFAVLGDGRILLCYSQFYGGTHDHNAARIAAIESRDGGVTWSSPREIVAGPDGGGLNVMSVSLLRLRDGRLALFYELTQSKEDCRPYISYSTDDGRTWTPPRVVIPAPGYYILNNDRVIQTRSGRIIMPLNQHARTGARGEMVWCYSDDSGASWDFSPDRRGVEAGKSGLQESGVVETARSGLFCWARTDLGSQFVSRSTDNGRTWTEPGPSELVSPLSPASIKRVPGSDDLLAVFNDHSGRFPFRADERTPLVAAISHDDGHTWPARKLIEEDTSFWYHYVAILLLPDAFLLAYNTGVDQMARLGGSLRIRRVEYSWLPTN